MTWPAAAIHAEGPVVEDSAAQVAADQAPAVLGPNDRDDALSVLDVGPEWSHSAEYETYTLAAPTAPPRRFWTSADMVNWRPHLRGLDYASSEDGSALTIGAGRIHEVSLDREIGVRAQLGWITGHCWGVRVGYTHFETNGADTAIRPPGTGQLFSSFSHPGGPAEADRAVADASFDYNVFDLTADYRVVQRQHLELDLFGGFRWADIRQRLNVDLDGRDFVQGLVRDETDLSAFGFRFGGNGSWRFNENWSLQGSSAVAAMLGKFSSYRLETNNNQAQTLVDLNDDYHQALFNLDTSFAVQWQRAGWTLAAGYEFLLWTSVGDSLRFVDDIEVGSVTGLSGDLLLEGYFLRVAKQW